MAVAHLHGLGLGQNSSIQVTVVPKGVKGDDAGGLTLRGVDFQAVNRLLALIAAAL